MNDFFTSVFTTDSHLTVEDSGHSDFSLITEPHITEDIVKKKLLALNIHKSVGPDGVPAYLLKNAAEVFAPLLTKLFNLSYEIGKVPKLMKMANIVPIFKKGDKRNANNYRPVSIIAITSDNSK